jgi:hypothetical protein
MSGKAAGSSDVRRSIREAGAQQLEKGDVKKLVKKIHENSPDCVILKIKDHMYADINSAVVDTIIAALYKSKSTQALYMQNLSKSFTDKQLYALVEVLKVKPIWCINIGENYEVSTNAWHYFTEALTGTSITHMYASEHVISLEMKNQVCLKVSLFCGHGFDPQRFCSDCAVLPQRLISDLAVVLYRSRSHSTANSLRFRSNFIAILQ